MKTSTPCPPEKIGLTLAENGDVYLHDIPLQLPPKESGVLRLLLASWPATVSKQHFDEEVWRGGMTDEGLARAVANLRRLLQHVQGLGIRSVYGRGYLLLTTAHATASEQQDSPPVALLETLDYAHQRMQIGSDAALLKAAELIREVMCQTPDLREAKLAYAQCLADMVAAGRDLSPDELDQAIELLDEADRGPSVLPSLVTLKAHLRDCTWRFDAARPLHLIAVQNSPEDARSHLYHGWHLIACGETDAAIEALKRALALAPYSLRITLLLAHASLIANDQRQFSQWVDKAHHDHPENPKTILWRLCRDAIQHPTPELLVRAGQIAPDEQAWAFTTAALAFVHARCGDADEARRLIKNHPPMNRSQKALLASTYTLLDEPDQALFLLQQAASTQCGLLPVLLRTPILAGLQHLPGFLAIQQQVFTRLPPAATDSACELQVHSASDDSLESH